MRRLSPHDAVLWRGRQRRGGPATERGGSAAGASRRDRGGVRPARRGGPAGSGQGVVGGARRVRGERGAAGGARWARGERAAAAGSELLLARAAGSGFLLARNRRIWEGWMPPPAGSGREGGAARERETEERAYLRRLLENAEFWVSTQAASATQTNEWVFDLDEGCWRRSNIVN